MEAKWSEKIKRSTGTRLSLLSLIITIDKILRNASTGECVQEDCNLQLFMFSREALKTSQQCCCA